jgi:uncharacterized protein (TIGR02145 family)
MRFKRLEFCTVILLLVLTIGLKAQTVEDIDGKVYKTVKIGTQEWMAENLAYKANSGCWAFGNDSIFVKTYGYLYNWETAQKVCPTGWHLPSDAEWTELIVFLGGQMLAGGKLKEAGTSHWASPNKCATNETGFNALPGGDRSFGSFNLITSDGYWWTSTESDSIKAWYRQIGNIGCNVNRFSLVKEKGFSVRCVKN